MARIDLTIRESGERSRAVWPVFLAAAATLIAAPLYLWLLDVPLLRNSGLLAFALLAAGAIIGARYAAADDRPWVRVTGGGNVLALVVFAGYFFWLLALPAADARAATIDTAPSFSLNDQNGRAVALRDELSRGPVLVVFYRGYWCPFCRAELRGLAGIEPALTAAGVRLLVVSVDPPATSLRVAERDDLALTFLSDPDARTIREYGVLHAGGGAKGEDIALPAMFLVAPDGRIVWRRVAGRTQDRPAPAEVLQTVRIRLGGS